MSPVITRLPSIIQGVELYALTLEGSGRKAERTAVATLGNEILHSPIDHKPDGSPYASCCPELPVSVSHSSTTAILAVWHNGSGKKIGVDIESPRRSSQLERVRSRFVAKTDDTAVLSLLHLWTAKEAAYKAVGKPGLSLTDITVRADGSITAADLDMQVAWTYHPHNGELIALTAAV